VWVGSSSPDAVEDKEPIVRPVRRESKAEDMAGRRSKDDEEMASWWTGTDTSEINVTKRQEDQGRRATKARKAPRRQGRESHQHNKGQRSGKVTKARKHQGGKGHQGHRAPGPPADKQRR